MLLDREGCKMDKVIVYDKVYDMQPLFVGFQKCKSAHSFGPYVRDCYLIHFCLSGRGVLFNKDGEHKVSKGQLFVIRPGEITTYTADRQEPWEYAWIGFNCVGESLFLSEKSVFDTPSELEERLMECIGTEQFCRELCLSLLYELTYRLFSPRESSDTEDRIRRVKEYIKYNYMLPISVDGLAREFGFDRSYLFRSFKRRYGRGVKEYLTYVRMRTGEKFLKRGFSVKETAGLVGYDDVFNFSKAFKAFFGKAPSHVRQGTALPGDED